MFSLAQIGNVSRILPLEFTKDKKERKILFFGKFQFVKVLYKIAKISISSLVQESFWFMDTHS